MLVAELLQELEPYAIDVKKIRQFEREKDFLELSFNLLREVGQYICIAACAMPADRRSWNHEEAILGGHFVRLFKLICSMLGSTVDRKREILTVIGRLAFECIINIKYLIEFGGPELAHSYKAYSLKHEKRLRERIIENIEAREGRVLPIEERMLRSVDKSFAKSGLAPEDVDPKKLKNWGGKNLFEKAREVGLEEAYFAAIGGASHSVHGNWQELLEYHLEEDSTGAFQPDLNWHTPRPQILNAVALHATEVAREHFEKIGGPEYVELKPRLRSLQARVLVLDRLHERYLSRGPKREGQHEHEPDA